MTKAEIYQMSIYDINDWLRTYFELTLEEKDRISEMDDDELRDFAIDFCE